MRRRPAASTALLALAVLVAGCGGGSATATTGSPTTVGPAATTSPATGAPATAAAPSPGGTTAPTPASTTTAATSSLPGGDLPPHDLAGIAAAFDPLVAPLGYRVSRGALIDRTTYQPDPDGGHLAVYLAPLEDAGLDRIAADFLPIVRTFLPLVFDQWPGLESFDVCQEPPTWQGDGDPPSLTLLDVFREDASAVDWAVIDAATLEALAGTAPGVALWITPEVRDTATWQSLVTPAP